MNDVNNVDPSFHWPFPHFRFKSISNSTLWGPPQFVHTSTTTTLQHPFHFDPFLSHSYFIYLVYFYQHLWQVLKTWELFILEPVCIFSYFNCRAISQKLMENHLNIFELPLLKMLRASNLKFNESTFGTNLNGLWIVLSKR